MKKFKMIYNGVVSVFNGYEYGRGGTVVNGKYTSHFIKYSVRPSKTNALKVSELIAHYTEDGSLEWHFSTRNPRGFVPRGLEIIVEIL